jgi:feruloyl esterase
MTTRKIRRVATVTATGLAALVAAACSRDGAEPAAGAAPGAAAPAAKLLTPADAAEACMDLGKQKIDGVTLTEATSAYAEQPAQSPGQTPVRVDVPNCKVAGTIDGSIKFELLLPDQWNGKFMMGGGGGFVGSVRNQAQEGLSAGATPLERGYATAGTDTGHTGDATDASWALGNAQAKENFAHLAVHRTAEVSKKLVAEYYDDKPEHSYFLGCSRGGGQAMISAQRYPEDFDGVVAGAPVYDWPGTIAGFLSNQQAIFPDPNDTQSPVITPDNRRLLAATLAETCDALDGVKDGVLRDPRRCDLDYSSLKRCEAGPAADCFTEPQIAAIQRVYRGPIANGHYIHPGFPFGGEADPQGWDLWMTRTDPAAVPGAPNLHYAFGTQFAKYFVYDDPSWFYTSLDLADWRQRTTALGQLMNATSPDLAKFRDAGGKLIIWHGWSDSALSALTSVDYYDAVQRTDKSARGFARLFLLPGVAHCGGGAGADRVDWITALEQWVERDTAPEEIVATKVDEQGAKAFERKLCAYPESALLQEQGDVDAAASYGCAVQAN